MEDGLFRFKKFQVSHNQSSMKVGVDAVLLGAWAGKKADNILEVGTGCGVISMILAQRFPSSKILAIDIDDPSVKEANMNFEASPWKDNLQAKNRRFPDDLIEIDEKYDLIVSNPPYFKSGIENPQSRREKARHQESLSVHSLITYGIGLLTDRGLMAIIFPIEFLESVIKHLRETGLTLKRVCRIRDREEKPAKRVMIECGRYYGGDESYEEEVLTLFHLKDGIRTPTAAYRDLCGELYLNF